MKPKWQPVAFPRECAPYGEAPFQPFLVKENAVIVGGGPSTLFLIKATQVTEVLQTIEARVRIAGFVAHAGAVYVQDGPVLSRWDLREGDCKAAINLIDPKRYKKGPLIEADWVYLHTLPNDLQQKQNALKHARRKVEWLTLLEAAEAELTSSPATRSDEETARLRQMTTDLQDLVGAQRSGLRKELADTTTAAASLIFSVPVVRTHQIGGKANAMVFVIGRDGKIHPIDDKLEHLGTANIDSSVRPSLTLTEWETEAHSDDWDSQLHYVTANGTVRAIDADLLPLKSKHEWTGRGPTYLDVRVRPRVEARLIWGGGAQGTGIFALPIDRPGEPSRVMLPLDVDWRWLEVRPDIPVALVSTGTHARLIGYAKDTVLADRFAPRPNLPAYYSTFVPQVERQRPLLVLEIEREAASGSNGPAFRLLVANPFDVPPGKAELYYWYPPQPTVLVSGVLEARGQRDRVPMHVRTQPTVSMQDVYIVARDRPALNHISALIENNTAGAWSRHFDKIGRAGASATLGDVDLPPLAGNDAIFCYVIGNAVSADDGKQAFVVLDELRDLASAMRLRIMSEITRWYGGGSRIISEGIKPLSSQRVTLRFGDGTSLVVTTDADGRALLPVRYEGQSVKMDAVGSSSIMPPFITGCTLGRSVENTIMQRRNCSIGDE